MSKIIITLERLESGVYLVEADGVNFYAKDASSVMTVAASVVAERVHAIEVKKYGCDYDSLRKDCQNFLKKIEKSS